MRCILRLTGRKSSECGFAYLATTKRHCPDAAFQEVICREDSGLTNTSSYPSEQIWKYSLGRLVNISWIHIKEESSSWLIVNSILQKLFFKGKKNAPGLVLLEGITAEGWRAWWMESTSRQDIASSSIDYHLLTSTDNCRHIVPIPR